MGFYSPEGRSCLAVRSFPLKRLRWPFRLSPRSIFRVTNNSLYYISALRLSLCGHSSCPFGSKLLVESTWVARYKCTREHPSSIPTTTNPVLQLHFFTLPLDHCFSSPSPSGLFSLSRPPINPFIMSVVDSVTLSCRYGLSPPQSGYDSW